MNRRDFLKSAVGGAVTGQMLAASIAAGEASSQPAAQVPRRPYGKEKMMVSIIGFPGLALDKLPQDEADQVVASAVKRGINYFDIAPTYGNAQRQLGPALKPFRSKSFLACKTTQRSREGAEREMKESLKALQTDHFDLYQLHAIKDVKKDVDAAFGKDGAMEAIMEAKKAGVIRHVGFSAHTTEAALAALERYDFDSALFPINYASWNIGGFGPQIMQKAQAKGVTCLALKGMCRQAWSNGDPNKEKYPKCWYEPLTDPREASLGLRWTLSQPIAVAMGTAEASLLPLAINIAADFRPIQPDEAQTLTELAKSWKPLFPVA
jgi:predicted aldo/keto reductase-like oxidoreductase